MFVGNLLQFFEVTNLIGPVSAFLTTGGKNFLQFLQNSLVVYFCVFGEELATLVLDRNMVEFRTLILNKSSTSWRPSIQAKKNSCKPFTKCCIPLHRFTIKTLNMRLLKS